MEGGGNFNFKKNDSKRIVIRCDKEYSFQMRISKSLANQFWKLVSLNDDHIFHGTAKNMQAKIVWIAKKFIPILRHAPEMMPKGLIVKALEAECEVVLTSSI
ncbi:unnamed protein product [Lathyrus sativus]|nr:unnamed protein product [Lathyrus sativus]